MSKKALFCNLLIVLVLGGIMTALADIDSPRSVKMALLTEQVDSNSLKINRIEQDMDQLSLEIELSRAPQ